MAEEKKEKIAPVKKDRSFDDYCKEVLAKECMEELNKKDKEVERFRKLMGIKDE